MKLHSSLKTIQHLILTHNTQDFDSINAYLILWLYTFKCDVYAQVLVDQTQKYFKVFYMFLEVISYFRAFSFCSKCIFVFFFKNWFKGCFARSSRLRASHEMCLRENKKSHFSFRKSRYCLAGISLLTLLAKCFLGKNWNILNFIQKLLRLSRDCFVTKRFSRKR